MIIFDLDGTLADCEHRRHFVDSSTPHPTKEEAEEFMRSGCKWKPDWKAFYEACDKDIPIQPVIHIWNKEISLGMMGVHQIWSGRCESVRNKTEKWLDKNLLCFEPKQLKMRPIGDHTPDDQLKEKWLDEAIAKGETIEYVFDDRPKVIRLWRRRGIFVFDVNQHPGEF